MIPDKIHQPRFYIDHINFQKAHRSANTPVSWELGCYIQSETESRLQPPDSFSSGLGSGDAEFDEEYYYEWRKIFGLNNPKKSFIFDTNSDMTGDDESSARTIKMQVSRLLTQETGHATNWYENPPVTFAGIIGHNIATKQLDFAFTNTTLNGQSKTVYENDMMNTNAGYTDNGVGFHTIPSDGISLWQKPRGHTSMCGDDVSYEGVIERSLFDFNFKPSSDLIWDEVHNLQLGSLFFGHHYDMPFNCEVSSIQERTFDGVTNSRNNAGADRINISYFNDRSWSDIIPKIDIYNPYTDVGEQNMLGRYRELYPYKTMTDKKRWSLTFSQLSHNDIIPSIDTYSLELGENPYTNWDQLAINDQYPVGTVTADNDYTYASSQIGGDSGSEITNYQEYSFFSKVLNYTMGGRLKFLFQPNPIFSEDEENPEQSVLGMQSSDLFLCKFDMDSFEIKTTGANTYQIKIDVVEVW